MKRLQAELESKPDVGRTQQESRLGEKISQEVGERRDLNSGEALICELPVGELIRCSWLSLLAMSPHQLPK